MFLEWNPNEEVAAAAEGLYGTIDHLELYAGLQAEDTKKVSALVTPSLVLSLQTSSLSSAETVFLPPILPPTT